MVKQTIVAQIVWRDNPNIDIPAFYRLKDFYIDIEADLKLTHNDCWEYDLTCVLDGKGHTITVGESKSEEEQNIISYLLRGLNEGGVIKNLNVQTDKSVESYYVKDALLCYENRGLIMNCNFAQHNEAWCHDQGDFFALVTAYNKGIISHCFLENSNLTVCTFGINLFFQAYPDV